MPHARSSKSLQPNRSDLTKPTSQTVPGQGYGVAAEQRAAQQQIPMGTPPAPSPSGAGPGPGAGAPPTPPAPGPPPSPIVPPGSNGSISRPTERPNEPVTHGLPMGPGAGPEALTGIGAAARQNAVEQGTLTHLLTSMAQSPGATSAVKDLAARALGGAM
jgi:hypothetical protein